MTTLKERALLNSLRIRTRPFKGEGRRRNIFEKSRKGLTKRDFELDIDLDSDIDDIEYNYNNEIKSIKLGDVVMAKQGDLIRSLMLEPVEREVMGKYGLSIDEIMTYKKHANNILVDGDEEILGLLDIPVDNPGKCSDCYRRVLYYIAELCKNERQIRADFFKSVS